MLEKSPDLSIVIINYKSSDYLRSGLRSIIASNFNKTYEIIVLDNCSFDPGWGALKIEFPSVTFVELDKNRGFSAGNNAGIRLSRGRAILLLNPDTQVNPAAIQILFDALTENETVGIVGPMIYGGDGTMQTDIMPKKIPTLPYLFYEIFYLSRIFKRHAKINAYFGADFDYDKQQEVEQVCGACLMVKREVLDKVGLMDDNYFLYFEETDLCLRAIKSGYRILFEPSASIIHFGGKSSELAKRTSVNAYYESELYFFYKHYGISMMLFLHVTNLLGFAFRLFLTPVLLIRRKHRNKILRHYYGFLYHINPFNIKRSLKK